MELKKKKILNELIKNHYEDHTIDNFKKIDDEQFEYLWKWYERNPNCFENHSVGLWLIYGD